MNLNPCENESLLIPTKDLECSVCYQRYGLKERVPMLLPCTHIFCSECLPHLRKLKKPCPTCRRKIPKGAKKDRTILSILENNSKTEMCNGHKRPREVFSKEGQDLICVQCFFDLHPEVQTSDSVDKKACKVKEKNEEINKKRQWAFDKLENSLVRQNKKTIQDIDDITDYNLAEVFSTQKKQKKEADYLLYSERERYEHQLLAERLIKYQENNQEKSEKWMNNREGNIAAQILEIDLETGKFMESFDKKVEELEKETENNHNLLLEKLSRNLMEGPSKIYPEVERNYLWKTLEEYGIIVDWKKDTQQFKLKKSQIRPFLKNFYPHLFDCTFEKLDFKFFNRSNFNFAPVLKIFEQISLLSNLKISLEQPASSSQLKLLADSILEFQNLETFTLDMSITKDASSAFAMFITCLLNLKHINKLEIFCENDYIQISFKKSSSRSALEHFQMVLNGEYTLFNNGLKLLSDYLAKSESLLKFDLQLGEGVEDPQPLKNLIQVLQSSAKLQYLTFFFAKSSLVKDQAHIKQIFREIKKQSHLKELYLFFKGNPLFHENVIEEIFSELQQGGGGDRPLEKVALTLLDHEAMNFQKIPNFLSCFPQLKDLKSYLYKLKRSSQRLEVFFKEVSQLKGLEEFYLECYPPPKKSKAKVREFEALLQSSIPDAVIRFAELETEDLQDF